MATALALAPLVQTIYELRLDPELWAEWMDFNKSLNVRGWERRKPKGFEFQYDGINYGPIPPGGSIRVPEHVAQHALKTSALFDRVVLPDGTKINELDKNSMPKPMLEIVDTITIDQSVMPSKATAAPPSKDFRCPFCPKSFDDPEAYVNHFDGHRGAEASKPGSVKRRPEDTAAEPVHAAIPLNPAVAKAIENIKARQAGTDKDGDKE